LSDEVNKDVELVKKTFCKLVGILTEDNANEKKCEEMFDEVLAQKDVKDKLSVLQDKASKEFGKKVVDKTIDVILFLQDIDKK